MSDAALIRDFVVRHADLGLLLERLREAQGPSNQHVLIRGPRGMGKTTLVNRVIAELRRDPALAARWYPIAFNEESYTVTSAAELWLQALIHLGEQTGDPELVKVAAAMRGETDDARLRDRALARLGEFADARGQRLLVVLENLDMLFEQQMSENDAWDIRHTLQNEPRIMVLATSTTRLETFHESDKPLYEIFWEHALEPLEIAEIAEIWRMVSGAPIEPHRARPIQILTGGNTRLLVILACFAHGRSFRELVTDLVGLIDENTPYFKHNIELLPPEERKIFITLADLWSPSTSRQVADRGRADIRKASALLGRLERRGVVEEVRRIENTKLYQVSERMYNLYHLLRRRDNERVRAFVGFLVAFYDQRSLVDVIPRVTDEACDVDVVVRSDVVVAFFRLVQRVSVAGGQEQLIAPASAGASWEEVAVALERLLADPRVVAARSDEIYPALALAAAKEWSGPLLRILEASASARLFEPLVVALRRIEGRIEDPPQELREVADDVIAEIEGIKVRHSIPPRTPSKDEPGPGERSSSRPSGRGRRGRSR